MFGLKNLNKIYCYQFECLTGSITVLLHISDVCVFSLFIIEKKTDFRDRDLDIGIAFKWDIILKLKFWAHDNNFVCGSRSVWKST